MKWNIMIYIGGFQASVIGLSSIILMKLWDMIAMYYSL